MATFRLKRKFYTQYDDTDNLKRMKDADILAEKPKSAPSIVPAFGTAAAGAAAGAGAGMVINAFRPKAGGFLSRVAKGGKFGAIAGGLAAGAYALNKRSKVANANQFYNDRLEYAQRQARRREKKDWKRNMTQREGYSY